MPIRSVDVVIMADGFGSGVGVGSGILMMAMHGDGPSMHKAAQSLLL